MLSSKCRQISGRNVQEDLSLNLKCSKVDEWEEILSNESLSPHQNKILEALIDKDFKEFIEDKHKVLYENVEKLTQM